MSERNVTEQLQGYGTWLQRDTGLQLRRASQGTAPITFRLEGVEGAVNVDDIEERTPSSPSRGARIARIVAAAAACVVALVGVAVLRGDTDPTGPYTASDDPVGPLYVLPEDLDGVALSEGLTGSTAPGPTLVTGRIWIGTADASDTAFVDIIQVCVSSSPFECTSLATPGGSADRIELDGRLLPVQTSADGRVQVVSEQRGTFHVAVRSAGAFTATELADVLRDVELDDDGVPSISLTAPRAVITTTIRTDTTPPESHSTWYRVITEDDGVEFEVSTATDGRSTSGREIVPPGIDLERVAVSEVNGVSITRVDGAVGDEPPRVWLMWRASPSRLVSVSSADASVEELTAIARSLTEVTEAEWKRAIPDHEVLDELLTADE